MEPSAVLGQGRSQGLAADRKTEGGKKWWVDPMEKEDRSDSTCLGGVKTGAAGDTARTGWKALWGTRGRFQEGKSGDRMQVKIIETGTMKLLEGTGEVRKECPSIVN